MFLLVAEKVSDHTEVILKSDNDIKVINRAKGREYPGYRKARTVQSKVIKSINRKGKVKGVKW